MRLDINVKGLDVFLRDLKQAAELSPTATSRALNRTASKARTIVKKQIRQEYNLKSNDLGRGLTLDKAITISWSSTFRLEAHLVSAGKRIALTKFRGTRATRAGVIAKVKKSSGFFLFQHAFIATMPKTGHVGVFERTKGKTRTGKQKLYQLTGPGIYGLLGSKAMMEVINQLIEAELPKLLDHELHFFFYGR